MANNPITAKDIYSGGSELKDLQSQLEALNVVLQTIVKTAASVDSKIKSIGVAKTADQKALLDLAKKVEALRALEIKTRAAIVGLNSSLYKQQKLADNAGISHNRLAQSTARTTIAQNQAAASAIRLARAQNQSSRASIGHSGSLTGLLGTLRTLTYTYFSLAAAQRIVGEFFAETKELNSLDFAYKTVLGTASEVASAKEFLIDLTERLGLDLLVTSRSYLKFAAASKQAGLDQKTTNDIFGSFAKTASVIGLSSDRLGYVFLALEQIMSKGRLSTEELRRQLGEHLPGAFGIAADAIGVTTGKLTDMLKKGEVISADFLPKFAKQVEIAYGIQNVKRVDNLAAAQGRYTTAWTNLVAKIDASDAFKTFFNTLASGMKFIGQHISLFGNLAKALIYLAGAWFVLRVPMLIYNALSAIGIIVTAKQAAANTLLGLSNNLLARSYRALTAAMAANPVGVILAAAVALIGVLDLLNNRFSATKQLASDLGEASAKAAAEGFFQRAKLDSVVERFDKLKVSLGKTKKGTTEYDEAAIKLNSALNEYKNLAPGIISEIDATLVSTNNLADGVEAYIARLEQQLKSEILIQKYREALSKREELKKDIGIALPKLVKNTLLFGINAVYQVRGAISELDELEAYIANIQDEIKKNAPDDPFGVGGGKKNEDDPPVPEKDPRIVAIERLEELNELMDDSREKELRALELHVQKLAIINEKDAEYLIALVHYKRSKIADIENKYIDISDKARTQAEDLEIKRQKKYVKLVEDKYKADEAANGSFAESEQRRFDMFQETNDLIFENSKHTDQEIYDYKIQKEIDIIKKKLEINKAYNGDLTTDEIAEFTERLNVLGGLKGKPVDSGKKKDPIDIFDLLGIDFNGDDEKKQAVIDTFDLLKNQMTDFLSFQKEIIDQEIENADRKVTAAERNLAIQQQLSIAGQANTLQDAQSKLAIEKKAQEQALKNRQRFQKNELAINTILEASNIAVGVAKALSLGPIIGPIAAGALILAFAAAKIKAFQLVNKKTFRKGGFRQIKGGSHESGNDTNVGDNNYAERDESVGIFTAKATRKHKPMIRSFVDLVNKGSIDKIIHRDQKAIQGISISNNSFVDTSLMEKRLGTLVRQNASKSFVDANGNIKTIDRGRVTTIINKRA